MKPSSSTHEIGWLPDLVFTDGKFEPDLAFFADETGRISRFSREPADLGAARRLKGQAALPGLVNDHSQALRRLDRGMGTRVSAAVLQPEDVYDAARMAFLEMLQSGITCVGECGALPMQSEESVRGILRAARDIGIRMAMFHAAGDVKTFTQEMDALRAHVADEYPKDENWLGVVVPGFGALPLDELKEVAAYAHSQRHRLQILLPATAEDIGQFQTAHDRTPVQLLADQGLLDKRVTVVHAGSMAPEDAQLVVSARALACVCPIVHGSRSLEGTSVETLRSAGVEIALGTDDQVRINMLEAARQLHQGGAASARLHAATVAGARSLGTAGGALEVGRPADFFTVNLYDPSVAGASPAGLLDAIIFSAERRAIREVWVGARPRITNGRHTLQGPIVGRFVELQQRRGRK